MYWNRLQFTETVVCVPYLQKKLPTFELKDDIWLIDKGPYPFKSISLVIKF